MSIKNLFEKPVSIENASTSSLNVESSDYILAEKKRKETFYPYINFSSASNFAKFGSAYEYYTKSIERIYGEYPYDGSNKEKIQFELSSSYLDKYIFDKLYPKTTGFIKFSPDGWGALNGAKSSGFGTPNTVELISIKGGIHTASSGMAGIPLYKTFDTSVVYDAAKKRTKTFLLNPTSGWTFEFWLKKDAFDTTKTDKEVIIDLWNGEAVNTSDYGRFRIVFDRNSGNPCFRTTVWNGDNSSGVGIFQTEVSTTGLDLGSWTHYALSLASSSAGLVTRFYSNGTLNRKLTHAGIGILPEIPGLINGQIGALMTGLKDGSAAQYAGKLSGSMDEFRFWKVRRTSREIYDNYYIPVGAGTNTDDANIDLGLYYKFNEGITQVTSTDSTVLDYSGRIANGTWTGYKSLCRDTGSAIELSTVTKKEEPDPIIYSFHPDVSSLKTNLQASGSAWDEINPSMLYNTIPQWIREEDEEANSNVKYIYQIISSYFDTLYTQITALPALQNVTYPSASYKALPFAKNLLENRGLITQNVLVESDIFELFGHRDQNKIVFEEKIQEVRNLIYTNIYNNLDYIYRSKGTEKSIRNMLRCFGVDDEIVKLNVYTDGGTQYFNDNYKQTSLNTKYFNFNSPSTFESTVFLTSSPSNSNTYVTGSQSAKKERYSAFTAELDVIVPYKLKADEKGHFNTSFLSSSLFGMHEPADAGVTSEYTWRPQLEDIANFQIYLLRDSIESENAKFAITTRDSSIFLTSSLYTGIYNNQRWSLAVRVKPDKYPLIGNVLSSSAEPEYKLEFYGVTHDYDDVRHEFTLTSSLDYSSGSAFLSNSKRFYFGAHRENFSGSTLQKSDVKIGAFRYYMDYLDDSNIKAHNLDPSNYGLRKSYQNSTLFARELSGSEVPSSDLLSINFDLSNVTGSDSSGQFIIEDLSSGSTDTRYGWIDNIIRREHRGKGHGFPASVSSFIENEPIFSMKFELPEIAYTSNNIFIKGEEQRLISKDDDLSDNFYALEKSMNQVISEEMLKMFSSVRVMNNLVGKAVDRYRMEYKSLSVARRLFFEQNDGDPDFDRFVSYFKWIDLSVSQMIKQLYPISVRSAEKISNMVESHILERNKYQNKFPLLDVYSATETSIKSQGEMRYNWKFGHAPLDGDENKHCLWNRERKERTDIAERQTINDIILNNNNASALSASTVDGEIYEGSTYAVRSLAKPYSVSSTLRNTLYPGINSQPNKNRDYVHNAVHRHGETTSIGIPKNVLIVGEAAGKGFETPRKCKDVLDPNHKKNLNVRVIVGKFSGEGADPNPVNDNEVYTYRADISKLPVTLVSQSLSTGYQAIVSSNYSDQVVITNIHSDITDYTNEIPMQGPFTQQWTGGHQSRHIDINKKDITLYDDDTGTAPPNNLHNTYTRAEAWRILLAERDASQPEPTDGAFGFAGFDYGGPYPDPARKGATFYRGERAKRPLNIQNIRTTTGSYNHGNYYENYELISAVGKQENNLYFKRNPDQTNYLPSLIVSSSMQTATHALSLIAKKATCNSTGNHFGAHPNNVQPDSTPANLQGVYLDDTYLKANTFSGFSVGSGFTISWWMNIPSGEAPQAGTQAIFEIREGSNPNFSLYFGNNSTTIFVFQRYSDGTNVRHSWSLTPLVGAGWNHYMITSDGIVDGAGAASVFRLYINNVNKATTATSSTATNKTAADLRSFTKIHKIGDSNIKLSFDEIGIFNTVMSPTQINELYNYGKYVDPKCLSTLPNLVSYYHFDARDTTSVFVDAIGQNNLASHVAANVSFVGSPVTTAAYGGYIVSTANHLIAGKKNRTVISSRFSAPGGIEVQSIGYLDAYSREYSVHNALPYRNLTVRGSGSGEAGTIRALDIHGNRNGLATHLRRHSGKFGIDSTIGSIVSSDYDITASYHKIQRNVSRKPTSTSTLEVPVFNLDHDNYHIQRPIPQSDFQYSWITASMGNNYGIASGKQRIYGYAPRSGEIEVLQGGAATGEINFFEFQFAAQSRPHVNELGVVSPQVFTISDGNIQLKFEQDENNIITEGGDVLFVTGTTLGGPSPSTNISEIRVRWAEGFANAVNASALNITATDKSGGNFSLPGGYVVLLTNNTAGTIGNIPITRKYTTVNDLEFGMRGGTSSPVEALVFPTASEIFGV